LAGLTVEFSVRSPPLTFVGAGVIVFEFSVFWIFGIFILTVEFIKVFGVGEVASTEFRLTIQFGIGFTAQTAHVFAGNLRYFNIASVSIEDDVDTLVHQYNFDLRSFFDNANNWITIFFQFDVFVDSHWAIVDGDHDLFTRLGQRGEDDFVCAGFDFQFLEIRAVGNFADHDNEAWGRRAVFGQNDVLGGQRNSDFDVAEGVDSAATDLACGGGFVVVFGFAPPGVHGFIGISAPHVHGFFGVFAPQVFQVRSSCFHGSEDVRSWDIADECVFLRGFDFKVDVLFVDRADGYDAADFVFRVADHDLGDIGLFVEMVFQHVENFVGVVLNEKRNVVVIDINVIFQDVRQFGGEFVSDGGVTSVFVILVHAVFGHVVFEHVFHVGFDGFGFQGDVVFSVAAGTTPCQASVGHDFVANFSVNSWEHGFAIQASNEGVARVRWGDFQFHLQFAVALSAVVQVDQVEDHMARASFNFDFQSGGQRGH